MNINFRTLLFLLFVPWIMSSFMSCESGFKNEPALSVDIDDAQARSKLMDLLKSIENKDIEALEKVMSTSDEMDLIFTNGSILLGIDSFVEFHRKWFQDKTWTITHEVVDFKFYGSFATSTVKAYYNEADRDGLPYFHNMVVSYVLRRSTTGVWMIIKDQATTLDKTIVK